MPNLLEILANAVNYLKLVATPTGQNVRIDAIGDDANIGVNINAKGTTFVNLGNNVGQPWFAATGPATGCTNYVQATGELVGVAPGINTVGLDTDMSITVYAKNAGAVALGTLTSPSTSTQFATFLGAIAAVNYFQFQAALAGSRIEATAIGSDANIDYLISAKGSGQVHLGANNVYGWDVIINGTGANRLQTNARSAGSSPDVAAVGADADINVGLVPKGAGTVSLNPVPSTGSASAGAATLPANPVGFITVIINGTSRKIPYYAT